jgi:hypothetical protein
MWFNGSKTSDNRKHNRYNNFKGEGSLRTNRQFWARLVVGAVLLCPALVTAAAFTQGYQSKQAITPGSLVELDASPQSVKPATQDGSEELIGVVVNVAESVLNSSGDQDSVVVATSGLAMTIVSDLGGEVNTGDRIAVSAIAGIGMKATAGGQVVGVAQAGMRDYEQNSSQVQVKDSRGQTKQVKLTRLPVMINPSYYGSGEALAGKAIPQPVQNVIQAIAGRPVSAARSLLVMGMFLAALVFTGVMLASAVRNSLISIGRNPLAKGAVYRGLWQVLLIAVGVLGLVIGAIYLVLKT